VARSPWTWGRQPRDQSERKLEARQWTDKDPGGILKESGVENMNTASIQCEFDKVLSAERLADVASVFSDRDFCDEVPLYSRFKQVEFLKRHGDVNALLMELALEYLDRVKSEVKLASKRLVAISVSRDNDDGYIVPAIFVCNRETKTQLRGLRLAAPSSGLGQQIEALVKKARPDTAYIVLEDDTTVPGDVRVFVSFKSPVRGLENLETFAPVIPRRQVG
jgi:hypothetical protein